MNNIDEINIINNIKSKIKCNTYTKGSTVYYISNNKIKKGVIIEITNDILYVCRFKWFPIFKKKVIPGINCFKTKELAIFVFDCQLRTNL